MRGSRNFCQFYLVLILFYRGGPIVLLLSKLYLPRIQMGSIIFQGVSNFFPGGGGGCPNANFFRKPYTYLLFSRGVSGPPIPSGSEHGQCHHNGTIFITVPLLTIIVRH